MIQNLLSKRVRLDIVDFLQLHDACEGERLIKTETLFHDKRDLQIQLYAYLDERRQEGSYDRVYADYKLKQSEDLIFDLVVRQNDKFVPVQLTYDPNDVYIGVTRFASHCNTLVLPRVYSAATDFWKSVHQIDMMRLESSVDSGIALFLSNNYRYWEPDWNLTFIYSDRAIDTRYAPPADAYMLKNIPKNVPLLDSYTLEWNRIVLADEKQGHSFQYVLLEIPQQKE